MLLKRTSLEVALLLSVLLVLCVERTEGPPLPLIFFLCFSLAYCGLSLAVHVYCAAAEALIVAAFLSPERFAKYNQIIYLRFLRNAEPALK
jgi:hypothetical protein